MGWTYQEAHYYTDRGKIDRKKECDSLFTWEEEKIKVEVLKSVMKGSVYYAALQITDKQTGSVSVEATVVLTHLAMKDFCNFGYKVVGENMGPCEDDCPKSILSLLTETTSEYAREWRKRCAAKRDQAKSLNALPIGAIIEFQWGSETMRLEKMPPMYKFKTPWFKVVDKHNYIPKKSIKDWTLISA